MSSRSIGLASKLLVALTLLAVLCGDAWAKKRVAVAPFEGRGAGGLQDEVEELLEGDNTVVSQSAFARARRKVRGKLDDGAIARISADLQLDAVILGTLERRRRGRGYTLYLTVREGQTGAVADTFSVRLRDRRLDRNSERDLVEKLLPALSAVGELGVADVPLEITPAPTDDVDHETPLVASPPDPSETTLASDDDESRPSTADEMVAHRHNRHAAIDVQAGMSAGWRNLRFTFADDLPNAEKPRGYKGSLVPSVMVTGEIYPLALGGKRSALSGLGIGFVFDRVLLLKSKLGDTEFSTSQTRYGAGLRYRYAFGNKATLPTVKLIAGWNHLDFTIAHDMTDFPLPNVSYSYVDLGAGARFPLGTPNAAIYADFRYMVVLGAGQIMEQMYYGDGSTLGIDGDIGIELIFLKRAILKIGGRYQRIAFDFDGSGAKTTDGDGDPTTQDVGGALDQYFSAYVTAGYLF